MKTVLIAALVHAIVHLRSENPPAAASGYVYMANGVLPIGPSLRDPRQDAVLVLEPSAGSEAVPQPSAASAAPVEVRIYGARALPEIIVAGPNTPILFRNDDRRSVTLLCRQARELFPNVPLAPGSRLAVTPPGPGQFDLRSTEYPHLRATLLVPRGRFSRLEWNAVGEVGVAKLDMPEGTYQARLFFLHRYVAAQEVTVTNQGSEFVLHAVWPTSPPLPSSSNP